jgi:Domain of Unknown Function (DUF1259)
MKGINGFSQQHSELLRTCPNPDCYNPHCRCGDQCQCTPDKQCGNQTMGSFQSICEQFAQTLGGKAEIKQDVCSVSLKRSFNARVQGKPSKTVTPVGIEFESLDQYGNALNILEIAILQEEIPSFMWAVTQQGLIVSALHNHWILMEPMILYMHVQSVEPPLQFAKKLAKAFYYLSSRPIPS